MNRLTDTKSSLQESLNLLATKPNMRPFLFRTRFERTMVRLLAYTDETQLPQLHALAEHSLNKIRAIVDKSNTTATGELYSHSLLIDDIQTMMRYIA